MQAGRLNKRVTIQQESTAQDWFGQESSFWDAVYVTWASIDIQASQLLYSTAEFVSKTVVRITFRWTSSVVILPSMRIVYGEPVTGIVHTYQIQSLLNDKQADRTLIALCYEINPAV